MTRFWKASGSVIPAVLFAAGLVLSSGAAIAQTTSGTGYSTTDPNTGDVYYYDASGALQYYTVPDSSGGLTYYNPDGSIMDPLHAFCWGGSSCVDNGTNTPTSVIDPKFGFSVSPGPASGDYQLDVLVPNNNALINGGHISGTICTGASTTTCTSANWTANLVSPTAWTSGDLSSYLGIKASPNNPLGAYLPSSLVNDPTATGFDVYRVDLGTNSLCGPSTAPCSPYLSINSTSSLDLGSYVVGFLNEGTTKTPNWIATANSGALFITGKAPEPATLLLMFGGLLGLGFMRRSLLTRPA